MDRRDIEVEPVTELSGLEALAPEWRRLFEASLAGPFQSPDWLIPWARTFISQGLWTLAMRRAGRLIGLAPLFVHTRARDGARQLTLLGNGISDHLDLIAAPGDAQAVAEGAFSFFAQRSDLW